MQGVGPSDGQPDRSDAYAAGRRRSSRSRPSDAAAGGAAGASEPPKEDDGSDDDGWLGLDHVTDETRLLYSREARRVCLRAAVAEVIFGVLLLMSFWAAYGWSIVVAGLAIVLGTVGYSHYQTPDSVASNSCCCRPISFIHQQQYMHLILTALSLASIVSSIVGAVLAPSPAQRGFAIIATVASVGTGLSGLASHVFSADLVRFCVAAQGDLDNAHVIMVRPGIDATNAFATAGHAGNAHGYGQQQQQQQHPQQYPPQQYQPYPSQHQHPPQHHQHHHHHQQQLQGLQATGSHAGGGNGFGAQQYPPQQQHHHNQQHAQQPGPGGPSWAPHPQQSYVPYAPAFSQGYGYQGAAYTNGAPHPASFDRAPQQPPPLSPTSEGGSSALTAASARPTAMVAPAGTAIAPTQPPGLPPGAFVVYPVNAGAGGAPPRPTRDDDGDGLAAMPAVAAQEERGAAAAVESPHGVAATGAGFGDSDDDAISIEDIGVVSPSGRRR